VVCLQSLGSSIDALKTLGPLLEAGFTGREDKPQAVVEAFRDYWDLTYANIPVPKGGWPSSVMTCLQACGRNVTAKPTPLPAETGDVAALEKSRVPTLEPAFTWGSSSTIAVEEDGASDATETSQDSNPFITRTKEKEVDPPSTPKAAPVVSSPQRPSKTATIRRTDMIFSPLAPTALDFVVAPASPTTPSRQPRTPLLRSPKKTSDGPDKENSPPKPPVLTSVLERIAMASPGGGGAFKLGKRRASNTPVDQRPAKKNRSGYEAGKPNDDCDSGIAAEDDDDSEAEREEVQRCLLRPVTPSPGVQQQHRAASFTAFNTVPRALLPRPQSCGRSPSPTPTSTQHNRTHSRKRKGVFMDAVEVPTHKPQQAPRRSQPRRHSAHMTDQLITTQTHTTMTISGDEEATPLSGTSSGPAVRRSLRHAKSLVGLTSTGVAAGRSGTLAQSAGKRQKASVAVMTKTKAKAKSAAKKATNDCAPSDDESDEDVVGAIAAPLLSSSSPISASLKRARVLFGSGKCPLSYLNFFFGRWAD